ncbi:MAG: tRNA threonylcarbamoyladenosine dehydratase [Syntrophomonadaceae bacterium]
MITKGMGRSMTESFLQRTRLLIGDEGLNKLQNSWVAVIGLGGVGSFAAEGLVRSGVGRITLVDHDTIAMSNINRQLPALHSTLGRYKAEVMAERVLDINPSIKINFFTFSYSEETYTQILNNNLDYVVDAIDSFSAKVHIIKSCLERKIPIISCMGAGNRLNPYGFKIDTLNNTTNCPLARKLRRELRKDNLTDQLTVLYSSEVPVSAGNGQLGSIPYVTGVAGLLLAGYVVSQILDK